MAKNKAYKTGDVIEIGGYVITVLESPKADTRSGSGGREMRIRIAKDGVECEQRINARRLNHLRSHGRVRLLAGSAYAPQQLIEVY